MPGHEKIIILQLACTNTNNTVSTKLLLQNYYIALNVLSIASYTLLSVMSCIEKKYSKQTSLNFDDKKYIGTVSVSQTAHDHPCRDIRK